MSKILKVVGASWLQTKISSYVLGILGILAILALFVGQIERLVLFSYSLILFDIREISFLLLFSIVILS